MVSIKVFNINDDNKKSFNSRAQTQHIRVISEGSWHVTLKTVLLPSQKLIIL